MGPPGSAEGVPVAGVVVHRVRKSSSSVVRSGGGSFWCLHGVHCSPGPILFQGRSGASGSPQGRCRSLGQGVNWNLAGVAESRTPLPLKMYGRILLGFSRSRAPSA